MVKLVQRQGRLLLISDEKAALLEILHNKESELFITGQTSDGFLELKSGCRGLAKQILIKAGYPLEDLAGYVDGTMLDFSLLPVTSSGKPFSLRDYQEDAANVFFAGGSARGGSGVLVLPCGAGKTVIGLGVMSLLQCETIILTTNITAAQPVDSRNLR